MKKLTAIFLCLIMILATVACSQDGGNGADIDLTLFAQSEPAFDEVGTQVMQNEDFFNGDAGWGVYTESGGGGSFSVGNGGKGMLSVSSAGLKEHSVQLYYDGFRLIKGAEYELKFKATCSIEKQVEARIQLNGGDYRAYCKEVVTLGADETEYTIRFVMEDETDPSPRLAFNCGLLSGENLSEARYKVVISEVSITVVNTDNIIVAEDSSVTVKVNQLGYRPDDSKIAVFTGTEIDSSFDVVDASGNVVYTGKIGGTMANYTAEEYDSYGDFSEVTEPGTYKIVTKNMGESYEFRIAEDVYSDVLDALLYAIYYQRCGCEINTGSPFDHGVCHSTAARIYGTEEFIDVSGGWHDAGDFGRYIVPAAKTVVDLLIAYENAPDAFGDDLGIPESGNGIADILDEVRYELEWMFKMQSAEGGVYHKVTCAEFPGNVMPEDETAELIVCPISTTATGDFAASMARAYTVYKDIDAEFADKCLAAAQSAYAWLEGQPAGSFRNPSDVVTGEYGDANDADERYWACCELFRATGDDKYNSYIGQYIESGWCGGFGWADVAAYGTFAYLSAQGGSEDICEALKQSMSTELANIVDASKADGYGISLGDNYPWGSNMTVANNAMYLLLANNVSADDDYTYYAARHIDYLLGYNPLSISYVTGYGSKYPEHIHHRVSQVVGSSVPGLLAGGPDGAREDPFAASALAGKPPAKCYIDNDQSYSTNEVTIYWNSPMIAALALLEK